MKKLIFLTFFSLLCLNLRAQTFTIVNHSCETIVVTTQAGNSTTAPFCGALWASNGMIVPAGTTSPTYTPSTLPWIGSGPTGSVVYLMASVAGGDGCPATIVSSTSCGVSSAPYTTCYCSGSYTVIFSTDASGNVTVTVS